MISCPNCGSDNPASHAFCSNCGNALVRTCPSCGSENEAGHKFCFNCGASLVEATGPEPEKQGPSQDPGERRLVSVVFADLVGYTTLSEGRDPEDVRSMLTHYYDRCREIIDRYGGVTDKFIGDAVMGVFGAESAHEDDAERATRTALELVDMVKGLGGDIGMEGLSARAGVMSGEASVGSGGNEHGLVVGDLVNTASRLQSIAPPSGVYVGESTRDLVGPAIEFAPIGEQQVKGKEEPVAAYEAKRVVAISTARRGGELADGPFVGREDELRLLKDQLHATGREGKARMVSIIGEGGIGKTRLSQELLRYIDGITEVIYYHNGRSPSYGDGVTFWALGEMVRQRAGILEGEDAAKSRLKLRTAVAEFAPDPEDQRWIEPRLAALIGLDEMPAGDRSELYAAMRSFFQKIAERGTVLMVFEDLHWADEGLLDFIEEMVERATQSPILILALARPELLERRSDWGASRRRSLLMHLSRLDDKVMRDLVAGLVPGIPGDLCARIAERTAGVPLHAVEFVRMLLNTGQLVREGESHVLVGDIGELAVPDSVNAIISARLDRLDSDQAALIQDASVLGLSFTLEGIAELRDETSEQVEPMLRSLVRSDVLELDEDPRSPERGQYRFVQSLIREVAYGRLTKSERVSRHLEVARRMESLGDPELAGVVAGHYASAAAADPSNVDLLNRARAAVISSAERAASLHSDEQAASLYRQALDMTTDPLERAELQLPLAISLDQTGRADLALEVANQALETFRSLDESVGVAKAATTAAEILSGTFEPTKAKELILSVFEATPPTDTEVWARLASQTSRAFALSDESEPAIEIANQVLPVLEDLELIPELLDALITKGTALTGAGRLVEGLAILGGSAALAADHQILAAEIRALNNLIVTGVLENEVETRVEDLDRLIARSGNTGWQIRSAYYWIDRRFWSGELDKAKQVADSAFEEFDLSDFWITSFDVWRWALEVVANGVGADVLPSLVKLTAGFAKSDDPQIVDWVHTWIAVGAFLAVFF